jgi:hypothetical protein
MRRWMTVAALTCILAPGLLQAQEQGSSDQKKRGSNLLMLVSQKVVSAGDDGSEIGYWWSNPTEPQWTGTDRSLISALDESGVSPMKPAGDVRISRIYRTPDLSVDNAAALASLLDARRAILGRVTYRRHQGRLLGGLDAVEARARLQLVDVASAEPSVIRDFEINRAYFGDQPDALLERAQQSVSQVAGRLLGRTVGAASGPIGITTGEPLLAFRNLQKGAAMEVIRSTLGQLDVVDSLRIRWASEGIVAFELNPAKRDESGSIDYATRSLLNHSFKHLRLSRRDRSTLDNAVEFDVQITGPIDEQRPSSEEAKDNE